MVCKHYNGEKCINQLIRPTESLPKFMLPKGMGDCATCKPCRKNIRCSCYTPISMGTFTVGEDV